ncbi:MAG: hypothetical protein AAGA80_10025 [Cyanobacteria bacterium P01_F01_bin.143]
MIFKIFQNSFLIFISSIILTITFGDYAVSQTQKDYWEEFRQKYPLHFQSLLISDPNEEGQRTLIISEPPPTFKPYEAEQILEEVFGSIYLGIEERKHPIGFNGWVRDYVVTLSSPEEFTQDAIERQVDDGIAALSYRLYHTTYKAHALKLPIEESQQFSKAAPNLSITSGELKSWMVDSKREFISVDTSESNTLENILDKNLTGVFLSQQPGFTILVLPRNEDIRTYWSDLRKFSLDSDIILGAITQENDDALVIIGREREASLNDMPPLRPETILTLAATSDKELYQSFERTHLFAGKLVEGELEGKDWAPIYLSDNLINTEFGSLLNITDQLLKSWSMAGQIEYANFPYPKQLVFPFDNKPLIERIDAGQILFNWNTSGLGAVYDFGNYEVFATTKTGALPITYGSDLGEPGIVRTGELTEFEEEGYDYFSQQSNLHLTRVTQYTALYQIFQAFPVKSFPWENHVNSQNISQINNVFKYEVLEALRIIETGDKNLIVKSQEELQAIFQEIQETENIDPEVQELLEELKVFGDLKIVALENRLEEASQELEDLKNKYGFDLIDQFATYIAEPRKFQLSQEVQERFQQIRQLLRNGEIDENEFLEQIYQESSLMRVLVFGLLQDRYRGLIKLVTNKDELLKRINAASDYKSTSNIKTPTIVISQDTRELGFLFTGGHNLNSTVTKFTIDSTLSRGDVEINSLPDGQLELRVNPEDATNSSSLARIFSRNLNNSNLGQIEQIIEQNISFTPPRKIQEALNPIRGEEIPGLSRSEISNAEYVGFQTAPEKFSLERLQEIQKFAQEQNLDLYIERLPDGFVMYQGFPPGSYYAKSPTALFEIVGSGFTLKSGKLYFENFSKGSVESIVETLTVRTNSGGAGSPPIPPGRQDLLSDFPDKGRGFNAYINLEDKGNIRVIPSTRRTYSTQRQPTLKERLRTNPFFTSRRRNIPNWSQAEIKKTNREKNPSVSPTGIYEMSYEVEIPIQNNPIDLLFKLFSAKRWTEREIRTGETLIQDTFTDSFAKDATLEEGILQLEQELKDNLNPDSLEFFYKNSIGDIEIIRRRNDHNDEHKSS